MWIVKTQQGEGEIKFNLSPAHPKIEWQNSYESSTVSDTDIFETALG